MDDATASDNCGEVTFEVSSETTAGDAAAYVPFVRSRPRRCGQQRFSPQTITVKTTAPEFTSVPATTP